MRKWAIIASIWLVAATTLAFAAVAFGDEHHGDGDHVSSGSSEYHHHGDDGGHHDNGGHHDRGGDD